VRSGGPSQARATDRRSIHLDEVGPREADRPLGRNARGKRIAERAKTEIEDAAGELQGQLGFKHDGELGRFEAAHMHQGSGTRVRRNGDRMRECIADLAQCHQTKGRRQVELAPGLPASAGWYGGRHQGSRARM
jgi:hypothetical protein